MQIYPAFIQHVLTHMPVAPVSAPATVPLSVTASVPPSTATPAYPTDSALRAKHRRQQHQLLTGAKPTVTHQRKEQEVHYDDCGDDFTSIMDPALLLPTKEANGTPLATFRRNQVRFLRYCLEDSAMTEDIYMALTCLIPADFHVNECFDQHLQDLVLQAKQHYLTMASSSQLALWQPAPHHLSSHSNTSVLSAHSQTNRAQLVELFGGKAGCTSIATRRNLRAMQNID
eukprot:796340-Amphidinium_carterae.2